MTFDELKLIPSLLANVRDAGYSVPTPIQEATIPLVLEGDDVLGCAQTGTGKTAAFALPILQRLQQQHSRRPDAKVITGTIKANIPGRVAFKTATSIDSRTILDDTGAENLIGRGDMLFKSKDGLLIRAQGAWISDPEIAHVVQFIEQHSNQSFDPRFAKKLETIKEEEVDLFADPEADEKNKKAAVEEQRAQVKADAEADDFKKAVECVINTGRASTSHFQRQMGWGYNHAAKILDMLTERGVVSPPQGMGPRQIVMSQEELLAIFNGTDAGAPAEGAAAETPADDDISTQEEQQ